MKTKTKTATMWLSNQQLPTMTVSQLPLPPWHALPRDLATSLVDALVRRVLVPIHALVAPLCSLLALRATKALTLDSTSPVPGPVPQVSGRERDRHRRRGAMRRQGGWPQAYRIPV